MNIPGDEFYTLLNAALKARGKRRYSVHCIMHCVRRYCAAGYTPGVGFPVRECWLSSSRFHGIPSMRRWNS